MRRIQLKAEIQVFKKEEMEKAEQALLEAALQACDQAYAPYSDFRVGVALGLDNGHIMKGANQENPAYPMCICAEPVALSNAKMAFPEAKVMTMAIRIKSGRQMISEPAAPCGACRQMISEYESRQKAPITLLLQGEEGDIFKIEGIESLLPLSFNGSFLIVP